MAEQTEKVRAKLRSLTSALESGADSKVRRILNSGLAPVDVARLIENSPPKTREMLWELLDSDIEGEVLQDLSEDLQAQFLAQMSAAEVVDVTSDLETDDVADILQQLPDQRTREVLDVMDQQDREQLEDILSYPEDSAGGLMNTDTITIRADVSLDVVLRYLRLHKTLPEMTDNLLVVSRSNEFVGLLPINKLLVSKPEQTVRELMSTDTQVIPASMEETDVAKLFERFDLVSAPVVDAQGILLGRITIDDVVDVIRETADHSLMSMAGLDEDEDTFAPAMKTSRRRAVWLGINLLTALAASAVIGIFDATIEAVVALAVLMPIVASMGGIAGSQVLTLVVRGQALGQLSTNNLTWLFNRELIVAAINGLLWAAVISVITLFWFSDIKLAAIIAAAIVINLIVAALSGAALPLILKARGIDPALAGSVVLTTITDVVGFFSFLGLATIIYL